MKVRVTLKDPDTMHDAVDRALESLVIESATVAELDIIRESRAEDAKSYISNRWMPYGEYLIVEFDTDEGIATVLPASAMR